jgi:hypothetical protein
MELSRVSRFLRNTASKVYQFLIGLGWQMGEILKASNHFSSYIKTACQAFVTQMVR